MTDTLRRACFLMDCNGYVTRYEPDGLGGVHVFEIHGNGWEIKDCISVATFDARKEAEDRVFEEV